MDLGGDVRRDVERGGLLLDQGPLVPGRAADLDEAAEPHLLRHEGRDQGALGVAEGHHAAHARLAGQDAGPAGGLIDRVLDGRGLAGPRALSGPAFVVAEGDDPALGQGLSQIPLGPAVLEVLAVVAVAVRGTGARDDQHGRRGRAPLGPHQGAVQRGLALADLNRLIGSTRRRGGQGGRRHQDHQSHGRSPQRSR